MRLYTTRGSGITTWALSALAAVSMSSSCKSVAATHPCRRRRRRQRPRSLFAVLRLYPLADDRVHGGSFSGGLSKAETVARVLSVGRLLARFHGLADPPAGVWPGSGLSATSSGEVASSASGGRPSPSPRPAPGAAAVPLGSATCAGRRAALEIRDGPHPKRSERSERGTVRRCRVLRHYLPVARHARGGAAHLAAWSGSTRVRRFTARVGSMEVQATFRLPALMSRGPLPPRRLAAQAVGPAEDGG